MSAEDIIPGYKAFLKVEFDEESPAHCGPIPGLVILGSIGKQAEQTRRSKPISSKPVSSTPPWPLHQGLPPGSCPV